MISNRSDEDSQGKVLGINQSVQAIASSMPLLLGIIAFICLFYQPFVQHHFPSLFGVNAIISNPQFTLMFGVISSVIGYLIYLFNLRQYKLKT